MMSQDRFTQLAWKWIEINRTDFRHASAAKQAEIANAIVDLYNLYQHGGSDPYSDVVTDWILSHHVEPRVIRKLPDWF